jgi:DeoR/GlpR family transcriptional regulator of sugar metabolism
MNENNPKLFSEERRDQIADIVRKQRRITVYELCQLFSVSEVTIRKDLAWLEKQNIILRTHGGAVLLKNGFRFEFVFERKDQ